VAGIEGTRARRKLRIGWEEHMWKLMRKKGKMLQERPGWLRKERSSGSG
jgi:3'-phosphoadenosine 5'-phosphosulfate sulfotransferase